MRVQILINLSVCLNSFRTGVLDIKGLTGIGACYSNIFSMTADISGRTPCETTIKTSRSCRAGIGTRVNVSCSLWESEMSGYCFINNFRELGAGDEVGGGGGGGAA